MYVRSEYKKPKKFAIGGAVVLGSGEDAIMRPPPGEPSPIDVLDDIPENVPAADQVAAAIAKARNPRSEMPLPDVRQPVSGRFVSAPVSREATMSWTGKREDRPGSITLTAEQKSAAKIAGISEVEYCRQLIRLKEAKANGDYLESR